MITSYKRTEELKIHHGRAKTKEKEKRGGVSAKGKPCHLKTEKRGSTRVEKGVHYCKRREAPGGAAGPEKLTRSRYINPIKKLGQTWDRGETV